MRFQLLALRFGSIRIVSIVCMRSGLRTIVYGLQGIRGIEWSQHVFWCCKERMRYKCDNSQASTSWCWIKEICR